MCKVDKKEGGILEFGNILHNAVRAKRREEFDKSDQLSLGELIAKLEAIEPSFETTKGDEKVLDWKPVFFDFEYTYPTGIESWRGSYDELALTFAAPKHGEEGEALKLQAFLELLRGTIGKTFTGWKGGDFTMGKTTPIWVANSGNSGNTAVIGVFDQGYEVILLTAWREF